MMKSYKVVYNESLHNYCLSKKAMSMLRKRGYNLDEVSLHLDIPSHNKDLVEIVEILGKEASANGANLKIFQLPSKCCTYRILANHGLEPVEYIAGNWTSIHKQCDLLTQYRQLECVRPKIYLYN